MTDFLGTGGEQPGVLFYKIFLLLRTGGGPPGVLFYKGFFYFFNLFF